ncbi:MAG: GGDEF domain-containing protein, partial [Solirubrobacteraceae bacterium]|nr:GGDEF domain-containing protein [Solirubrobacteraceae bacterium]
MALLRRTEPRLPLPPAVPPQSVLSRPEVAIVPALVMAFGALGVALSQVLRPDGQAVSENATEIIASWAVLFAIGAFSMALFIRNSRVLSGPHAIWVYVLGSLSLLGALSIVSLLDSGIATVAFGGAMLLSFYVGFVFPYRIARAGLVVLLALLGILQLAVPRADGIEVLSVFALAITGWLLGRIPRQAHKIAAKHALILSRSDVLTRILNRRGFLEEFAFALRTGAHEGRSVALVVIDLNGFKLINDQQGHAAGDEMLAWVAERIGVLLPADAIFGRLGGDEFAIGLPGITEPAAEALAKSIHAALSERIGASIGVAAQPHGETGADDLFRSADIALYAAKADPTRRVQVREADPSGRQVEPDAVPAPVSYAKLRAHGGPREATDHHGLKFDGTWVLAGFFAIGISGLVFVVSTWLWGGDSAFEQLIRYGGPPWILVNLGLGLAYRNTTIDAWDPNAIPSYMSAVLVGVGVGTASLSTGDGVTTPIIAGLYLKLIFDGATFRSSTGLRLGAIIVTCWLLVVILGPADALWAVPFQLVMIVGSYRLGQVG